MVWLVYTPEIRGQSVYAHGYITVYILYIMHVCEWANE